MKLPTVEEMMTVFFRRREETRDPITGEVDSTKAMAEVRDLFLVGEARARLRASILDRQDRRAATRGKKPIDTNAIILRRIARAAGLQVEQLVGPNKRRKVTRWRDRACWALCQARGLTLAAAGQLVDLDFSTVGGAVRRVKAEIESDPRLGEQLRRLAA